MFKWVVCDLDGTLLKHDKNNGLSASKETISIINRLKSNGLRFTFATGRHYLNAINLLKNQNIMFDDKDFVIGLNGTQVYSFKKNDLILQETLKQNDIEVLKDFIPMIQKEYLDKFLIIFYGLNNQIIFLDNQQTNYKELVNNVLEFHGSDINQFDIKHVKSLDQVGDVFKCTFYINDANFKYEHLKSELSKLSNKFEITKSLKYLLEVMPKNINKAISLEYINQNFYNINKSNIIAFGDSQNDFEMFKFAGTSVTRQDADEKLKKIASYIIDAQPSDFVGDGLELLIN